MGVFFSRASGHFGNGVTGSYPAGDFSSVDGDTIAPFIGINTGSYDGLTRSTLPPIPFEWIVSPASVVSRDQCPPASATLLTFGLTDLATAALAAVLTCQPVIRALSFGALGNRRPHATTWTWIFHLAFLLLGNAVAAALVGRTSGYEKLNMLHIFTIYSSRPRISTVLLAILRSLVGVRQRPAGATAKTGARQRGHRRRLHEDEFPYADAYIAAIGAEFVLQIIAAIFTAVTWNRMPPASDARDYMASIVQFVQANPGLLALAALALVPVYRRYDEVFPVRGLGVSSRFMSSDSRQERNMSLKGKWIRRVTGAFVSVLFIGFTYLIQYDYWTQFLELPGVL